MGNLFKRYPSIDMQPVLCYICHMIRDHEEFTLAYVLHTILKTMYGWTDIDLAHLQSDQLDLLAAGTTLLCEGKQANAVKKNIKALESLVSTFWSADSNIAARLMTHVAYSIQFVMQVYDC